MLVTVFCVPRDRPETTFALDVSPELELRDFVALCELESGIPAGEIHITYVEQPLKDPIRALGTYGVKDGDVVVLRQADKRPPPTQPAFSDLPLIDFRSISVPGTSSSNSPRGPVRPPQPAPQQQQQRASQPSTPMAVRGPTPQGIDDPALLQQMLLTDPHELSLLKERNPPLAEALLSGDLEKFTKVLVEQQQDRAKREQERIRLLTADPFDLEAQAKIEEDIRQHNVEENMTIAMEEAPESFGQVVMLYINCRVNGHPVKAFVDSGAQMTIMSQACAERCNIMRLVDRRWAGIAKGVGTQKIIGRVHLAQIQIEGDFLPCSFSILEDQPMDMLLGLDMLKRHQCSIDLKRNLLVIGTTGTETRFLFEAELPECARLAYGADGREETRPQEIADRELAEALQRSIQESDTADGQATSPPSQPCPLPRTLHQIPSTTSPAQTKTPTLDRPQHAASTTAQAPTLEQNQDLAGLQELPQSFPLAEVAPQSSSLLANLDEPAELGSSSSKKYNESQILVGEVQPEATERPESLEENSFQCGESEELCPIQPMEQETTEACPKAPASAEMESPTCCDIVSSERHQPDGDRCSSTDSIPSLAAALKELHELIVSNNSGQSQTRSASGSPSNKTSSDSRTPTPENTSPSPSASVTANTKTSDAKASSQCTDRELHSNEATAETLSRDRVADELFYESSSVDVSLSELEVSPDAAGGLELREPPEGQHERGVADGQASSNNSRDVLQTENSFLNSLSAAANSPEESSTAPPPPPSRPAQPPAPRLPPPLPFAEQFPAEHIQRIQAAGFSAREATEALEQAGGVVELALLALLARSITMPNESNNHQPS